jgi:hypothetical protein
VRGAIVDPQLSKGEGEEEDEDEGLARDVIVES